MRRSGAALALAGALAGCAALSPQAPAPVERAAQPARQSPAEELVAYAGQLRASAEGDLAAAVARQRQAASRERTDVARLKLAIALLAWPQGDEAEVLGIVEPVARQAAGDAGIRSMASFLQGVAGERRRLKENAAASAARLRDERRVHEGLKQRADTLQERAAQLQQKLDALTELEKSLTDRQAPIRDAPPR